METNPNAPEGARPNGNGHVTAEAPQQVVHLPQKAPMVTGGKIAPLIPQTFDEVWRVATLAVKSGLTPQDLNTTERAAVAILHGMELRLPPMMALQRIAVINGRPSVWGDAVPAIAIATGELQELSETFEGTPYEDDFTAVCRVSRRTGTDVIKREARFSVADAKQASLWDERAKVTRKSRDGGTYEKINDSPWHRFPKRMLQMRARVAVRDLFADAMCGLYIAEELVGRDTSAEMRDITPAAHEIVHNPLGGEDADEQPPRQPAAEAASEVSVGIGAAGQPTGDKAFPGPADAAGGAKKRTAPRKATVKPPADSDPPQETGEATEPSPVPAEVEFLKPWNRQPPAAYREYALAWIGRSTNREQASARWAREREIRNGLSEPFPGPDFDACREALSKVGAS